MSDKEKSISESVKEYIVDPSAKIKLDDLVNAEIRTFLKETNPEKLPVQENNGLESTFVERIRIYEEKIKNLQQIVILLAKWGSEENLNLLEKILIHLAEADKELNGKVVLIGLQWYPLQILMYSGGITALSSNNFDALKICLQTQTTWDATRPGRFPITVPVSSKMAGVHDAFKLLPGLEKRYTPMSEHLFEVLEPTLEELLFLQKKYEYLFDYFEIINALVYAYIQGGGWGPYGRFGWKHSGILDESPFNNFIEEANEQKEEWKPIKNGMFGGSLSQFEEVATEFKARLDKLSWF